MRRALYRLLAWCGLLLAGARAAAVGARAAAASSGVACWYGGPRVDCGWVGVTQQQCEQRGCCWVPAEFAGAPRVDFPWCFKQNAGASVYAATESTDTGSGFTAALSLRTSAQPELGPDIPRLKVHAEPASHGIFRLRITDADRRRWEVPTELFNSTILNAPPPRRPTSADSADNTLATMAEQTGDSGFNVDWDKEQFGVKIARRDDGAALLDTRGLRLMYKEQYIELTTWADAGATLFGAGERATETLHLARNGMPRALWNHDLGPTFLQQNSYGSQPFVMALMPDGKAHGFLMLNSNGMDIVPTEDRLSWRMIGGVVDLFVLEGPTPAAVLEQLTRVVGRPAMMPAWALGWHQCRYGYKSVWEVEEVVQKYAAASIPLEAMWTDIDYMDRWKSFTFDPVNFPVPEMRRLVAELAARGQRWMPIVDPAIKVEPGYPAYERGLQENVFLKGVDGENYLGWVWPGATHFPDFLSRRVRGFYSRLLAEQRAQVEWAGMWIDMNEASNFCTGDVCSLKHGHRAAAPGVRPGDDPPPWVCQLDCPDVAPTLNATLRALLDPPYAVANFLSRQPLGTKGVSVVASHLDGTLQYNAHNVYGLAAALAVRDAVRNATGRRPFVLTRAAFAGTGAYAAHWTGDSASTWADLAWSLPGVLNIGLFGMPMAGADICGFQQDTTEELCARWLALGAFYPFARMHSDLHSAPQEPYLWPVVADTARSVLSMRYRLLPYLYSAFREAHDGGSPVMRPLWLNYPEDAATHAIHRQFMLGGALLVTPVLDPGVDRVSGYFPGGTTWYNLFNKSSTVDARGGARTVDLPTPLGSIPLHMAGGHVLAMQPPGMTTAEVRAGALTLVVALPRQVHMPPMHKSIARLLNSSTAGINATVLEGAKDAEERQAASGWMFHDDGDSIHVGASRCHFVRFAAAAWRDAARGALHGELRLAFGRESAGTGFESTEFGQEDKDAGPDWPRFGAVEVLGWHAGVGAARVEVTRGLLGEGKQTVKLPPAHVRQRDGYAALDLAHSGRGVELRCGDSVRVAWEAEAAAIA